MLQINKQFVSNERFTIRCVINSASLNRANYVSVILEDLYNSPPKVAWAPRKDIVLLQQEIDGDELYASLIVEVKEKLDDFSVVEFDNRGTKETVSIKNDVLAAI